LACRLPRPLPCPGSMFAFSLSLFPIPLSFASPSPLSLPLLLLLLSSGSVACAPDVLEPKKHGRGGAVASRSLVLRGGGTVGGGVQRTIGPPGLGRAVSNACTMQTDHPRQTVYVCACACVCVPCTRRHTHRLLNPAPLRHILTSFCRRGRREASGAENVRGVRYKKPI